MGNPAIGEELRQFFLWLLQDGQTLTEYFNPETREGVINRGKFWAGSEESGTNDQDFEGEAGDVRREAIRLLKEGSLKDIEEHILSVEGSVARPHLIVCPPM